MAITEQTGHDQDGQDNGGHNRTRRYELHDRYQADHGTVFLTGIQALARLPLEQLRADRRAGLNTAAFVAGYQGSPLGGYGEAATRAAKHAAELSMIVKPAVNEEYAATAVMGSQVAAAQPDCRYDGIIGVWYGKAPGVDRASDALRHGVFTGTSMHGGAVALVGDDPAAKSSTLPSSSAGVLADMHMPLLYPGDPGEALDLGRHAIAMSRATGLWSALKIVADVADGTASIVLDPDRVQPVIPLVDGERYQHTPDGRLLPPHNLEVEREILEVRYELAKRYAADNHLNKVTVNPADAWLGIVSSGITHREVREALARLGLPTDADIAGCGIRLLKMGMPMPFNPATIRQFARGLEQVMVIEEKAPNIESLVKDALYDLADRPVVVGKDDEQGRHLIASYGSLDADDLEPTLRRRLADRVGDRLAPPPIEHVQKRELIPLSVARSPYFCSGCPHNRSTEVPEGSLVGAGIGCHTMTLLMDSDRLGTYTGVTCMGSEGAQWIGMADFIDRDHYLQNLGDGTYFHSGQLAIQAAVAANVNITYKLLYNGTVAMTGGQDPEGQLPVAEVAQVLLTQGVARVLVTTDDLDRYRSVALPTGVRVWDRTRMVEAQELLAKVPGVTVLIHDQACAAEARRARKRGTLPTPTQRVVINHRICEGCGDCGQVSNCLSVQPFDTAFGRKTHIDQTTCNLDYSCLEGDCPSFMTIETEPSRIDKLLHRWHDRRSGDTGAPALATAGTPGSPQSRKASAPPVDRLPTPTLVVPNDQFAMRITGIGGTGVVTVAQVIGTAAMLDDYHVRGLDQIGLSQKAGPVVSDVRLSQSSPTATNRLGDAQADLLLAFDQLTAASPRGLLTADPARTTVVGSDSATPTGQMITQPDLAMPSAAALAENIAQHTRAEHHHWVDAQEVTQQLFGGSTTANMFVVGMAVQAGCLPISVASLHEAIELNGVAVEANLTAFAWGRLWVHDSTLVPVDFNRHVGSGPAVGQPATGSELSSSLRVRLDALSGEDPELAAKLGLFASELLAFGNAKTVTGWLGVVEQVAAAEQRIQPSSSLLTGAVAAGLYKLTAYKDEYEVARLMTDADGLGSAKAVAGDNGVMAWRLHPPMLRALGMEKKVTIGAWAEPAIRALAKGKRLRGTPLDPFGRAEVRRVEQALPDEYVAAVQRVLRSLTADNLPAAVRLAELPDMVRGYEHIKLANVTRYQAALQTELQGF